MQSEMELQETGFGESRNKGYGRVLVQGLIGIVGRRIADGPENERLWRLDTVGACRFDTTPNFYTI